MRHSRKRCRKPVTIVQELEIDHFFSLFTSLHSHWIMSSPYFLCACSETRRRRRKDHTHRISTAMKRLSISIIEGKSRYFYLSGIVLLLIWPLSMLISGIRYRDDCAGQTHLPTYHMVFGCLWMSLFLLNLTRYYCVTRYLDIISITIWIILFLFIIPGYMLIFDLRSRIRVIDQYPVDLCNENFYKFSCISIILVHIPLYIFLWILWSFTHSNEMNGDQCRPPRIFSVAPMT